MPFKIWNHPRGEMTVNEYVRRLAELDKKNIDALKKAAMEQDAATRTPARPKRSRKTS